MLQISDITQLVLTRHLLRGLENRAQNDPEFRTGKLDEACHAADVAIQNVLIIARHHFANGSISDRDIYPG